MFYDLNVLNLEEITKRAYELGYVGIAHVNSGKIDSERTNSRSLVDKLSIFKGIEIKASNLQELKKKVRKNRKKADLILVHGGDLKINRAAVEESKVDILCHPYNHRRDSGINHVLAKIAAENNVAIELNIRHLLQKRNNYRHYIISYFRQLVKLHNKYGFPLIITSGARNKYDLRSPLDLVALASCFGMTPEMAIKSLSKTPKNIIEYSKKRQDFILSGVQNIMEKD
jgi:ribonuclease P/MRP protein subunit RPP1